MSPLWIKRKAERAARVAAGLCAQCGKDPLETKQLCAACASDQREYMAESRLKKRALDPLPLPVVSPIGQKVPEQKIKQCTKCGHYKHPVEDFHSHGDGRRKNVCKECEKARVDAWAKRNPEKRNETYRRRHLKRKYGISEEQYESMKRIQGDLCAICGKPEKDTRRQHLCVDHCHTTGRVRGLLCFECNLAIGNLEHDVGRLKRAITYLERVPLEKSC